MNNFLLLALMVILKLSQPLLNELAKWLSKNSHKIQPLLEKIKQRLNGALSQKPKSLSPEEETHQQYIRQKVIKSLFDKL